MSSPPRPTISQLMALANAGQPLPVAVATDLRAARTALHQIPTGDRDAFKDWLSAYTRGRGGEYR